MAGDILSCRATRKDAKKRAPAVCVPTLRFGQPVVLGHGLRRGTRYAPAALHSNNRDESVDEACPAAGQPAPCAPQAQPQGGIRKCCDEGSTRLLTVRVKPLNSASNPQPRHRLAPMPQGGRQGGSAEGPPRTEAAVPLHRRLKGGRRVSVSGGSLQSPWTLADVDFHAAVARAALSRAVRGNRLT